MSRLLSTLAALLLLAGSGLPARAQSSPAVQGPRPIIIGQAFTLESTVMGQPREINVWLPPSYQEGDRRYPVIYLLDGGLDQDFQHIAGLAQLGTVVGTTRDVILVGVASMDRQNELAFRASHDQSLIRDYPRHGQTDRFRQFLAEEVQPFVNARWRTDGDDTVMGESLAGLFVVETLLKQPDLFDTYIAISPSLWWDDEALAKEAPALLARQSPTGRRLWMTIGDEGSTMQDGVDRFNAALGQIPGYTWTYAPRPDETHATIYHPAALDALRELFAPPVEPGG